MVIYVCTCMYACCKVCICVSIRVCVALALFVCTDVYIPPSIPMVLSAPSYPLPAPDLADVRIGCIVIICFSFLINYEPRCFDDFFPVFSMIKLFTH